MSEIKITKNNFEEVCTDSKLPVLIDFWATWCGPCQMIAPYIEALAKKHAERLTVGKINVDEEPELATAFNINSIPTLLYLENGSVKDMAVGYKTLEELEEWLGLK